eukprot:5386924-Amphidinium_carterae.2
MPSQTTLVHSQAKGLLHKTPLEATPLLLQPHPQTFSDNTTLTCATYVGSADVVVTWIQNQAEMQYICTITSHTDPYPSSDVDGSSLHCTKTTCNAFVVTQQITTSRAVRVRASWAANGCKIHENKCD